MVALVRENWPGECQLTEEISKAVDEISVALEQIFSHLSQSHIFTVINEKPKLVYTVEFDTGQQSGIYYVEGYDHVIVFSSIENARAFVRAKGLTKTVFLGEYKWQDFVTQYSHRFQYACLDLEPSGKSFKGLLKLEG